MTNDMFTMSWTAILTLAVAGAPGSCTSQNADGALGASGDRTAAAAGTTKQKIKCIEVASATGSDEADTANLLAAFEQVTDDSCIELAAGETYRLKIGNSLSIDGHTNVKIDGNGATLSITDFDASRDVNVLPGVVTLRSTVNAKVENLSIQLARPNHLFGTISSNGPDGSDGEFTVTLDPGFTVTPSAANPDQIYAEHVMHWSTPDMPGFYETFNATVSCPGGCNVGTTDVVVTAPRHNEYAVGQRMLILQDKRQTRGIELDDSVGAKIEKIRFGNLPGAAISGQRVTDLTMEDISSAPGTETVSQVSVNDLVYIRGAAGNISVRNVFATYQTDDAFNLHPPQALVTTVAGGNYDVVRGIFPPAFMAVGDTVLFYDKDLQPLGTAVITEVSATNIKTLRKAPRVAYIVPAKWRPASITLDNYHVANGRTRILVKAPNVSITNCSSRNNMMSGIDVRYRGESVAEAGVTENVTIRDCVFDNVARRGAQHLGAILVSSDSDNPASPWRNLVANPVHGTVTIENNQFINMSQSAILMHGAASAILRGNTFQSIRNNPNASNEFNRFFPNGFKAGAYTIAFAATAAAILENNSENGGAVNIGCVSEPDHPEREAICTGN